MAPQVTVIVACYNHGRYIEACLRSVFAQTHPHVELLVIDDGSTDDSVARLRALQLERMFDLRVQANRGLATTLNEAVARAQGTLLAPFGSDDVMLPQRLARQVEYLATRPEVGICAGNVELIDQDGQPLPEKRQHRDLPFRRLDFADRFLDRKRYPPAPTFLIRREAWAKAGGLDPTIRLEDLQLTLRVAHAGYTIDCLDEVLAQYRVHPTNTSKDERFIIDNVLRTYAQFAAHPLYAEARARFVEAMVVRVARRDRALARELLAQLPWRGYRLRTLRAALRLW